jgi:hypothetical protein
MTADYAYALLQFISRKNQTGDITPSNYKYAVSLAQNGLYDYLIGQLEQQRYDKPVPKVGIGQNNKVASFLLPLKVTNEAVTGVAGVFTYPTTFNYLSLMTDTSFKRIAILDDTKFPARYNSKIDPLTDTSSPFGRTTKTGWLIYPTTVTNILVSYYFRPPNTVWGFTLSSTGRKVYDQSTSVDPVFDDVAMTKVIGRACKILGISFKEEFLVEYGKEVQMVGE